MRTAALLALVVSSVPTLYAQEARIEQIIEAHVKDHSFMGSVLIAKGDQVLLNKGYGSADLEWNIPNSPTTKFRLGSVTKQFTAACVFLLQERGKLNVDDPVKKYMPDAPAAWDKITIYHVLTHTSGIPNFTSFPDYPKLEAQPTTPEELVKRFRDKPLDFEPGSKWSYSNSGYVLLGYLIEKVSGETYQKFLQENIFNPLGMKDSGYDSNALVLPQRASGYTPSKDGIENAGYINMTIPFSAGALYSTTEDLLKWERGLFGGKVLSPASLTKMTTPYKQDYACGLQVKTVNGHKVIGHGGGIEGFNTALDYWPEDQTVVVVLGNLNGSAPDEIASNLGAVLHGQTVTLPSERKEIKLSTAELQPYVGVYELAPGIDMEITLEGDHLESKLGQQPKVTIYPEAPDHFFLKVVDAQLTFTRDAAGKVTGVTIHQGGRDISLKRK